MAEQPEPPPKRIALEGLDWVVLLPALFGYLAIIVHPFLDWNPNCFDIAADDRVAVMAACEAAFWTKWTALSQAFAGVTALAAAVFAAFAYLEGRRSRVAAERQAKAAEDQLAHASAEANSARLTALGEATMRKISARDERRARTTERDERAASTRAVLVVKEVDLVRNSASGVPIFLVNFPIQNVGGSVALDVIARTHVEFSSIGVGERFEATGVSRAIRAIPASEARAVSASTQWGRLSVAFEPDQAREVINGSLNVTIQLNVEWTDVHGYRLTHSYRIESYFSHQEYSNDDVSLVRTCELIVLGEREAYRREIDA